MFFFKFIDDEFHSLFGGTDKAITLCFLQIYAFYISVSTVDPFCCDKVGSMFLIIIPCPVRAICLSVLINSVLVIFSVFSR